MLCTYRQHCDVLSLDNLGPPFFSEEAVEIWFKVRDNCKGHIFEYKGVSVAYFDPYVPHHPLKLHSPLNEYRFGPTAFNNEQELIISAS